MPADPMLLALATRGEPDDAQLLPRRLVVFYGFFSALLAFVWLVDLFLPDPRAAADVSEMPARIALSVHVLLLGGMVAALKLGLHDRWLRALDIVVTVTSTVSWTVASTTTPSLAATVDSDFAFFLLFFSLRAALVPSRPRVAAVVTAVSAAPLFAVTLWNERAAASHMATSAVWFIATVVGVYVIAHAVYGLQVAADRAARLGQYVIHEKSGEGGMGAVYRASHAMMKRPTAIKVILPTRDHDTAAARFEREVLAVSRLSHPNTVAIYDFGRTRSGAFYYAMEHLDGEDLGRLVRRDGPLPVLRAIRILRQIGASLAEAHSLGLIHRDIKPENVMLCHRVGAADFAKVLDFGLVKDLGTPDRIKLTSEQAITGTPMYLAPENLDAPSTIGPATDIYSLGGVAYWLLTGRPPFQGTNLVALGYAHLYETPAPMSRYRDTPIPAPLEDFVQRCLAKKPADRPTTTEFNAWLADFARSA